MSKRIFTEPTRKGCKRCGSKTVAWEQGKNEKWYLTEVFEDADGRTYTEHALLHSPFCVAGGSHKVEQDKRLKEEHDERKQSDEITRTRRERAARDEAEYFLELHDMCKLHRANAMDELANRQRELDRIQSNPTSMDYMTDRERELQRVKRLTVEIAYMSAALGLTPYEDEE